MARKSSPTPLKIEPFVQKLAGVPKAVPAFTVHFGFLGKSEKKGYSRIYSSLALSQYVEVPNSAIRHSVRVTKDTLSATAYWVDKNAKASGGITESVAAYVSERQSEFLSGDFSRTFLGATGVQGLAGGGGQAFTSVPCTIGVTLVFSCVGCGTAH